MTDAMLNHHSINSSRYRFRPAWLYLAAVAYGSLLPFQFAAPGSDIHGLSRIVHLLTVPRWMPGPIDDLVLNALLYAPFGWITVTAAMQRCRSVGWTIVRSIGIVAATSWTVECLQHLMPMRFASLTDWLLNAGGAGIGALAALILRPLLGRIGRGLIRSAGRVRISAQHTGPIAVIGLLLMVMWLGFDALPQSQRLITPSLDRVNLMPGLPHFQMSYDAAARSMATQAGSFALIALMLSLAMGKGRPSLRTGLVIAGVMGIALAAEAMKLLDAGRYPDVTDPLLAALTAAFVGAILRRLTPSRPRPEPTPTPLPGVMLQPAN